MATHTDHHTPTTDVEVQEEQPKTVEVPPEASVGAAEKPGWPSEALPEKKTQVEVEGTEGMEAVSEEVEKPVGVPEVEARYGGQAEKVEKPEEVVSVVDVKEKALSEEVEPKTSVEGRHVEDKAASADKFDDSTLLKEEKTSKEEDPGTTSEQVVSFTTQETRTDHQEEVDGKASVPEVVEEKPGMRDKSTESSVADVTENTLKGMAEMKEDIAKVVEVEAKHVEATTDVNEPIKEPEVSGIKATERENVETSVDKLEEGKAEEVSKSDVQKHELTSKQGDETETKLSKDLRKEDLAKPTEKQSNNIISKVKQSLVKAKKAIIGKSPSSKTLSSGTKGDIKVK